jgi:hypothetical protein
MKVWSWAVNQGAYDAGIDFARGQRIDVKEHVEKIIAFGAFSTRGMDRRSSEKHSYGQKKWKKNWNGKYLHKIMKIAVIGILDNFYKNLSYKRWNRF